MDTEEPQEGNAPTTSKMKDKSAMSNLHNRGLLQLKLSGDALKAPTALRTKVIVNTNVLYNYTELSGIFFAKVCCKSFSLHNPGLLQLKLLGDASKAGLNLRVNYVGHFTLQSMKGSPEG
ncbi:hypothetical protein HUJ04_007447 [Dendroctonus ponderosae]|nr:hypothetical protein HUJ04_007447 [Dendroctonus ponderosae]KAH1025472.1 hypothetical protein HUJ05_010194 [Dendroctonus ponderosae]